ncbi:MAG: 4Fe-4S binding protein [Gammaproteobacteria bacterium]|nr:4Fe-4S binding protein [Gammaproteobacteria bacterium]
MNNLQLPDTTANGRARAAALDPRHRPDAAPASTVEFLSHGRVLIVGEESGGLYAAQQLDDDLVATVCVPGDSRPTTGTVDGLTIVRGGRPQLLGTLGNFHLSFPASDDGSDADAIATLEAARFDLVLDLNGSPLLRREVLPPGYYAPGRDAYALETAIAELPDMRGEFEKPKYFNFDPDICAHGRRGISGCTRCLDVCPTQAIASIGDTVQVDANLCQGYGSCASVCPTGAITYAFPGTSDLLAYLRTVVVQYGESGGAEPVLLFYDSASAGPVADELAESLPENALPVELEEVGSVGMDAWFACLAYGVRRILILGGAETPPSIVAALEHQIDVTARVLEGMGYPGAVVQLLDTSDAKTLAEAVSSDQAIELDQPARFVPPEEKRLLLRTAINHLFGAAPSRKKVESLPKGAPFGHIRVDKSACTMCMGCVAVCPTSALRAGQGLPQLNFVEWSCIQCGVCESACPEDAIESEPRFLYDDEERSAPRRLHEEQPMCCIACGTPFATRSTLDAMMKKLEGHWMFQTKAERRRLEMCDTCRVKDMMRDQGGDGPRSA